MHVCIHTDAYIHMSTYNIYIIEIKIFKPIIKHRGDYLERGGVGEGGERGGEGRRKFFV